MLFVIKTLTEVQKNLIDPYILVRILQRLARDTGTSASSHMRQGQRTDPDSAVTSSRQGADIGAVISNQRSVMKLISERVRPSDIGLELHKDSLGITPSKHCLQKNLVLFLKVSGQTWT